MRVRAGGGVLCGVDTEEGARVDTGAVDVRGVEAGVGGGGVGVDAGKRDGEEGGGDGEGWMRVGVKSRSKEAKTRKIWN